MLFCWRLFLWSIANDITFWVICLGLFLGLRCLIDQHQNKQTETWQPESAFPKGLTNRLHDNAEVRTTIQTRTQMIQCINPLAHGPPVGWGGVVFCQKISSRNILGLNPSHWVLCFCLKCCWLYFFLLMQMPRRSFSHQFTEEEHPGTPHLFGNVKSQWWLLVLSQNTEWCQNVGSMVLSTDRPPSKLHPHSQNQSRCVAQNITCTVCQKQTQKNDRTNWLSWSRRNVTFAKAIFLRDHESLSER